MLTKNSTQKTYRVSLSREYTDFKFDPGQILHINDAIVLDNLYLSLVDQTDDGRFVSFAADSFQWKGRELRFTFSGRSLTSKGNPITAEDAEASLRRLLILNQNSHGLLSRYLCQTTPIKDLNDSCESIFVEGSDLVITPNAEIDKEVFLSLLSGVDFKVLPKRSFAHTAPFKITDYSETTGAYFLRQANRPFVLESNQFFHGYSRMAIHQWTPVFLPHIVSDDELGKSTDVLTTSHLVYRGASQVRSTKLEKKAEVTAYLAMTSDGIASFSLAERSFVVEKLRAAYLTFLNRNFEPRFTLFGPKAISALPKDWETLQAQRLADLAQPPQRKFRIGAPLNSEPMRRLAESISMSNENIEFLALNVTEARFDSQSYDAVFSMIDTSYIESITYFEYGFRFGVFGVDPSQGASMIEKIIRSPRSVRQETLSQFHREILEEGRVFPIAARKFEIISTPELNWSESDQSLGLTSLWKARKAGWF